MIKAIVVDDEKENRVILQRILTDFCKDVQLVGEADDIHYPTIGAVYTHRSNRFEIRYVKQVEGIVCAGGICRLEPAFSGLKMSVRSTF